MCIVIYNRKYTEFLPDDFDDTLYLGLPLSALHVICNPLTIILNLIQ